MSRIPSGARRAATAGLLATGMLAAAGHSALAADATLDYRCEYPLIGVQPLEVAIRATTPQRVNVGERTSPFAITATATPGGDTAAGLRTVLAASLEGTASASATLTTPGSDGLDLAVPITIAPQAVPASGPVSLAATGQTPPLSFPRTGQATIALGTLELNLMAKDASGAPIQLPPVGDDSDGNPDTFDVRCVLDPSDQSPLLTSISVFSGAEPADATAPTAPGRPTASASAPTSASLSWGAATDAVGVVAYEVLRGGTVVQTVAGTRTTVGGLAAGGATTLSVRALDAAGNVGPAQSVDVTTPPDTSGGTLVDYGYSIYGSSYLKTLTQGVVPIAGAIAARINLRTSEFTADLQLYSAKAQLKLVGFIPVTALVGFAAAEPTTGTLKNGQLVATAVETIKLPQLYLFGSIPVAGAGGCRTKAPSRITLRSASTFNPLQGGQLNGAYAIGELTDCGALTGIISPFAQGSGNTLSVRLTPTT